MEPFPPYPGKRKTIYRTLRWQIAALVILGSAAVIKCSNEQPQNTFTPDSPYIDTMLQDHSKLEPITSDTATPATKAWYDSTVKAQEDADSATPAKGSSGFIGVHGSRFRSNTWGLLKRDTALGLTITLDGAGRPSELVDEEVREFHRQIRLSIRLDSVLNARLVRQNFISL